MTSIDPLLLANLAALREVNPDLMLRITWPCGSEHVAWSDDGGAAFRIHREWHRLSVTQAEIAAALAGYDPEKEALLLGLGLGDVLERLVSGANAPVLAWERDPWLLRLVLSRRDWTDEISSGAVRFMLTTDLLDVAREGVAQVLPHPLLGAVYRHEALLLRDGVQERRVLLGLGGLFVDDLADTLRGEGVSVIPWDTSGWSREELARAGKVVEAEAALQINYTRGLAEACAEVGVPLRVWEIDPSTDELPSVAGGPLGPASQGAVVATWRETHVELFKQAGFTRVLHLPLAANERNRRPLELSLEEKAEVDADIVFVGSSMVEQGFAFRQRLLAAYVLARGGDPSSAAKEGEAAFESVLEAQRNDFSVYVVPERLYAALPLLRAPMASQAAQEALQGARADALLGEMAGAHKRITYVANLGQVGIHVWGDDGWRHVEEYGVVYRGPAGHKTQLTRIYNSDAIHLDIGRLYQSDIITMRVFDVLACGGFCLAEWSPGLEALFVVGEELDCYRTLEEMLQKVEYWLDAGPEARRAVGERGRQRVLSDHTIAHRLRVLLKS